MGMNRIQMQAETVDAGVSEAMRDGRCGASCLWDQCRDRDAAVSPNGGVPRTPRHCAGRGSLREVVRPMTRRRPGGGRAARATGRRLPTWSGLRKRQRSASHPIMCSLGGGAPTFFAPARASARRSRSTDRGAASASSTAPAATPWRHRPAPAGVRGGAAVRRRRLR